MDLSGFKQREIPEPALAELQSHFDEATLKVGTPRVREHRLGCDVLVNVEWFDHGDAGPGRTIRHTVVFLHRPEATLPDFQIHPRTGIGATVLRAITSMLGAPPLELEDEPAFSDRYTVMTMNPESVRILLSREAIDSLLAVDDLVLTFGGRGVIASRHALGSSGSRSSSDLGEAGTFTSQKSSDRRLDADGTKSLLVDTLIAGGAIVDDPETSRRAADAVEGSYASEAARHLQDQGGLLGRELAKTFVTGEMLDQIRTERTPRTNIPKPIARRAWGGTNIPLLITPVFSLSFATIGVLTMLGGQSEGLIFLGVGAVVGIIAAFVLRHRIIRRKLVIHGAVTQGRITQVKRTNTSVNDDPVHEITLQTVDGGAPIVVRMGSAPARQARRMMETAPTTWALRDLGNPSRSLWLEGWCLDRSID